MSEVILKNVDKKSKVNTIKVIQKVTKVSLFQAKQLVENTPSVIVSNVSLVEAREIQHNLQIAGAEVEVR